MSRLLQRVGVFVLAWASSSPGLPQAEQPAQAANAAHAAARDCVPIAEPSTRLACYDHAMSRPTKSAAGTEGMPLASAASVGSVLPESARPAADADFGLPRVSRSGKDAPSLVSHINGAFDGWTPSTRWMLANGQVWTIADGTSMGYPLRNNPSVRVTRGAFGGFFIEIEGVSQSPKVRRLR